MTTKVNQDLFYQMPADQDEKQQSPDRTKDSKAPPEPVPDFGTPLKASKSDEAEKREKESDDSPMIEDVAAKVEVKEKEIEKFKSLDDEFDAIASIKSSQK